jgi:hypothetical protein
MVRYLYVIISLFCEERMKLEINIGKKHLYILSLLVVLIGGVLFVRGQGVSFGHNAVDVYVTIEGVEKNLQDHFSENERITYWAYKEDLKTSTLIPEDVIIRLCSDGDGCSLRLGMHDYGTGIDEGNIASRSAIFYYDGDNKRWRTDLADKRGANGNDHIETGHIMQAWSCRFSDGIYVDGVSDKDKDYDFSLLPWSEYNANCVFTIID